MPFNQQFTVTMADGKTHYLAADDREIAALELQTFPEQANHTRVRFLCWHAMTRTGLYAGPFDDFRAKDCVTVDVPDDDQDAGQAAPKAATPRKSARGRPVR